jgi:hypothetical protein
MKVDGKLRNRAAHRVAFEKAFGLIPKGKRVLHRCDNKKCVNPYHLFLGTNTDNQRDSVLKGRHRYGVLHGSKNGNSKLSAADVRSIRKIARPGKYSRIARRYGVSAMQIRRIANGES